ncbi:glycosyltransferase family protein [Neisseria sp. CCUG12390]|uniref:glycosyltransferase family protein n=1 Tax=Neisseria sp. CCUG12390 TaxID=3392035 RepID=UPI003A0FC8E1
MKILYGVQATGNGHITRARAMLPALQAHGIEVDFVFSGRDETGYFDMECFGTYRTFRGFTYRMQEGRVRRFDTLADARPYRFVQDVLALDVRAYDLVLTDFEPVSAWAARRQGVRSVGLAHQYALLYPLAGMPPPPLLPFGLKAFAPADDYLGLHWQSFGQPILPPLVQVNPHPVDDKGFILVYLPFEDLTRVKTWLRSAPQQRFRIYAAVDKIVSDGLIEVHPFSRTAFPRDAAECSGVICNAGFGLCSEMMALGKKLLVRPLDNQAEQASNAKILQKTGAADVVHQFDSATLRDWLQRPNPAPVRFPDTASAVADWLAGGCAEPVDKMVENVWAHD